MLIRNAIARCLMATLSLVTLGGHTATHCNVTRITVTLVDTFVTHYNAASATVTLVATDCDTMQCTQHNVTHCDTMQYTATRCNTLRHDVMHCDTIQRTATLRVRRRHWILVMTDWDTMQCTSTRRTLIATLPLDPTVIAFLMSPR